MNNLEINTIIILSILFGFGIGILLGIRFVRKRDRELMKEMWYCLEKGHNITPRSVYHYSLIALFINQTKN